MSVDLASGNSICFNVDLIVPPNQCRTIADLVYEAALLKMPLYGVGWRAVSGPFGNGPLPLGWYECTNLRVRTLSAMVREGVGFSVDLNPQFPTTRTLLRIHPDGNVPGTLGCIGITADVAECYAALKKLLPTQSSVCSLEVKSAQ